MTFNLAEMTFNQAELCNWMIFNLAELSTAFLTSVLDDIHLVERSTV